MRNDDYFKRCDGLYHMILRAYVDKALLVTMESSAKSGNDGSMQLGQRSYHVLGHICELLKYDLALTIWKIYIDDNAKANTIKHLNSFVHKLGAGTKKSTNLSKEHEVVCNDITSMRHAFLGHNDLHQCNKKIDVKTMYDILNEIKEMYNALCNTAIDDRVTRVEEKDIGGINLNTFLGLFPMIQGGMAEQREVNFNG